MFMSNARALTLAAGSLCLAYRLFAADAFPNNEDLRHVRTLADPKVSPNGTRVLVHIADATAEGGRSHVWVIDVASNQARQVTYSPPADKRGEHKARWLGDDALLFLARRGERAELFRLPMTGGEAHAFDLSVPPPVDASKETDAIPPRKPDAAAAKAEPLPIEVDDYDVSPDAHHIAVIAKDPETPGEKKQKDDKADAQWVDHDLHGKRVYLLDAKSGKLTNVNVPPDVGGVVWSNKGDVLIAFVEGPNNASDLGPDTVAWLVKVDDPSHPTQLKEIPPSVEIATFSEDDTRLYYLAQAVKDAPPGYSDLFVLGLADHTVKSIAQDFAGTLAGKPVLVGHEIWQGADVGIHRTFAHLRADKLQPMAFDLPNLAALDCDGRHQNCAWLGQSSSKPSSLYFAKTPGRGGTRLNTPDLLPNSWPGVDAKAVHWSNEGMNLEGLLFLPPNAKGKVPLITVVHGGPTGGFVEYFDPMMSFLLGHGWALFLPNPRGSTGYGVEFAAADKNDLGGADYRDIMTGVDALIASESVDASKLVLLGYSYGGEMAGFVEGKTDRFKAIISGAPVIDQQSEYGTEADSWYDRWFYGKPWDNAEAAWRQSPLAYVAHAKTPFMLIQGETDVTDPLGQSQEMYRALRQVGVHVEMVQYPREGHPPLSMGMRGFPTPEPWHGFDVRQRIVKFIDAALAK
jgi:dipeptidyl aminopeptidase/acylaminoacyl peptidase